jgi:hypothetical protein
MAKRATDTNRRRTGRRNFAAWLMTLLPGFMFLGLLAPAAITIKPKAEESYGPVTFRNFAPRRPINIPVLTHQNFATSLAGSGIDAVFSGARYVAEQSKQVFETAEPKAVTDENKILLAADGVQDYVAETLFGAGSADDSVMLRVDLEPLWAKAIFDVVPGLIVRDGYQQWDDFHGIGSPHTPIRPQFVPEPSTGALLALGLGALALRRRRSA